MGCVQGKGIPSTSQSQELERLKLANVYLKATTTTGDTRHKVDDLLITEKDHHVLQINNIDDDDADDDDDDVKGKKEKKLVGADGLVGGWPKWLVDNIPAKVFDGLTPKSAESYKKLAKIGQGTYSNVYKGVDKGSRKVVALKKVRFDTTDPESIKFMGREIMVLQQLNHQNVIKLQGIATSRMQYSLYLVFDYMQSDLTKIISRHGQRLSVPQIKCYMKQMLLGLEHCHAQGILHRDIKGSNLLIDRKGVLKIADFGLSNSFGVRHKHPLTSRVVTLWYRAPELLLGSTDYGVGIDLWSAGCLLAEMFFGRPIMPGRTEVEQLHRIFKLCGSPPDEYYKKLRLPANFRPPQNYKPGYQEAFSELPESCFSLLTTLLAIDPTDRGTASSALQNEFFFSSPQACDLSGLPVINNNDEPFQMKEHKRPLKKHLSQKKQKGQGRKVEAEHKRTESDSSKEEKNTWYSSGSVSSSLMPIRHEEKWNALLSPVINSNPKNTSSSLNHPNATKNILLQASITDIVNLKQGNPQYRRSVSTLDFRKFDPEKISRLFHLETKPWDLYEI